jgi:UDP:flavonoid glycosyltransferase YjiC (YdhE family)
MGSTQKALAHGVPVCAVPFGRDQLEVARRVEVARAGTRLPAARLRAERLRVKVAEAMACTDGARRIAAAFAAIDGPRVAADAVEQRLLPRR